MPALNSTSEGSTRGRGGWDCSQHCSQNPLPRRRVLCLTLIPPLTSFEPESVSAVEFGASETGKASVVFATEELCSRAFKALPGEAKPDTGGLESKKVTIHTAPKGGKVQPKCFIKIRKMV